MTDNSSSAIRLYNIVNGKEPHRLLQEVLELMEASFPGVVDVPFITQAHADVIRLFNGDYPGYRHSTTWYHDLQHSLEVFLCSARLVHGALTQGIQCSPRMNDLIMASSLFHDSGLIQEENDRKGTGAKYTVGHEKRSVAFLRRYFDKIGRSEEDARDCALMIETTCLGVKADDLPFCSEELRFGANVLATADLLAQMADREYLEKLLLLYLEFEEAGLPYDSAHELLEKTHGFYDLMMDRMTNSLGNVKRYAQPHFKTYRNINRDLYDESIQANMEYLYVILDREREKYLDKLKRGGIVDKISRYL